MANSPRWLTILNQASKHRRDVALLQLGKSVAEAEALRRVERGLNRQLADDSMSDDRDGDTAKLNLARLHQRREHRNEVLSSLSDLKLHQQRSATTITQQRDTVQQHTSESRKLERLGERIAAQQATAHQQAESRMALEELSVR